MDTLISSIHTDGHEIHFNHMATVVLNQFIARENPTKIFVLVDTHTRIHCLPSFKKDIEATITDYIIIEAGEENKQLDSCKKVWESLSNQGADRNSLLINLGGGVVTDLGGFVASTFKRGISFINIPTTLLAMVDASVGGKTGIDFGVLKNQIGTITQPKMVLIYPKYLTTLPKAEYNSGKAEMLKHGLIADKNHWESLIKNNDFDRLGQIKQSISIKGAIVSEDPYEKGIRKSLNFGHSLGHAIESFFLASVTHSRLLHGEAIAIGMIMESFISHKMCGLSRVSLDQITEAVIKIFPKKVLPKALESSIYDLLKHDKKNSGGKINFSLLSDLGKSLINQYPDDHLIKESFAYYRNL